MRQDGLRGVKRRLIAIHSAMVCLNFNACPLQGCLSPLRRCCMLRQARQWPRSSLLNGLAHRFSSLGVLQPFFGGHPRFSGVLELSFFMSIYFTPIFSIRSLKSASMSLRITKMILLKPAEILRHILIDVLVTNSGLCVPDTTLIEGFVKAKIAHNCRYNCIVHQGKLTFPVQLISFGTTCHHVTNISRKSLIYQAFYRVDIIPDASNVAHLPLYNEIITVCVHLSKMNNFIPVSANNAPHFRFIIDSHPAWPIRLSLYNEEITIQTLIHKNIFSNPIL